MCTHSNSYVNPESVVKSFHHKQLWTNMNLFIKDHVFSALSVEMDFVFNYQLKNHINTHMDFVFKCPYSRCGKSYKSEGEYRRCEKVHQTAYQEYACTTCGKKFTRKKYRDEHLAIHSKELGTNVQNVVRNTGGIQAWQNT